MIGVMIVDDSETVRQGLRTLLPLAAEAAGAALQIVGEAGDGLEAVTLAAELQPDVIVMDLEMPRLDGCGAAQVIKGRSPQVRLVALTVHGDDEIRTLAQNAGFDAFLVKGAAMSALIAAISAGP